MCLSPVKIQTDLSRPWLHRTMYVPCGKCAVCRQKKANARTQKILSEQIRNGKYLTLFVTLTYDNEHIPYIKKSEIENARSLFVYRGNLPIAYFRPEILQKNDLPFMENPTKNLMPLMKKVNGKNIPFDNDKVSVCLYSDLQKFIKRLRINLQRKYGIKFRSYYACSEYGKSSHRAHFHVLLQAKREFIDTIEHCVRQSWTFCDWNKLETPIEIAKNAASYVSGYVSKLSSLPPFLRCKEFKPSFSHSQSFGLNRSDFEISSILQKIDTGNFDVPVKYESIRGKNAIESYLPLPRYVLYRYFPPIKGLSKLSTSQLFEICLRPEKLADYANFLGYNDISILNGNYYYDTFSNKTRSKMTKFEKKRLFYHDVKLHGINLRVYHDVSNELRRNYIRLIHCIKRFCCDSGLTTFDYARYFTKLRVSYNSYLIKKSYEDFNGNWFDHFDNRLEVLRNNFITDDLLYSDWYYKPEEHTLQYCLKKFTPAFKFQRLQDVPRYKKENVRILEKVHVCDVRSSVRALVYND